MTYRLIGRACFQFDRADLQETVESSILGVAEKIVAEDEAKRNEELVSHPFFPFI